MNREFCSGCRNRFTYSRQLNDSRQSSGCLGFGFLDGRGLVLGLRGHTFVNQSGQ